MQLAQVLGHATSTIKHPTLNGWRMLIVQPLDAREQPDGVPIIALDRARQWARRPRRDFAATAKPHER